MRCRMLMSSIGYKAPQAVTALNETIIMLVVLALIDVVMISNLLIMVIVGGFETFVSRHGPGGTPGPAGVAEPRECLGAQGQARHAIIGISLDPPAEDLHQRRQLLRADAC